MKILHWLAGGCWHRWEVAWVDGVGFTYRCRRCRLCRPYPLPGWPFHGGGETAAHS